jgi:hypothetical protein
METIMSELGKLSPVPATDWVTTINTEYAALEKADKDAITTSAKASHSVVERAIRFGGILKKAKDAIGHGTWGKWLKDNCKIKERTAQRYMKLADSPKVQEKMKSDTVSDLSLRKALALANGTVRDNNGDNFDKAHDRLIKKLNEMDAATAEAAAQKTITEIMQIVSTKKSERWKPRLAA